jgi:hypothetical protein
MDQVVVKSTIARLAWLQCTDSQVVEAFAKQENISFRDKQPPHRFTLCQTDSERVFIKLEISHTISDGTSIPILLRDLAQVYEKKITRQLQSLRLNNTSLPTVLPAPRYSDYIAYLQSKSPADDLNYWKSYLADIQDCHFPRLTDGQTRERELRTLVLRLSKAPELRNFCSMNGFTLSNVLQLVWAMVLRVYTGETDISFGYLWSGRDAPSNHPISLEVPETLFSSSTHN